MQAVRYSFRRLWTTPGFTLVAVFTLALGIGANTSSFSVADALVFRPVDIPDLDSLYALFSTDPGNPGGTGSLAAPDFLDFRQASSLEHLSIHDWWDANITGSGNPERVQGFKVSADFFQMMRVPPQLGRALSPEDAVPGKDAVTVLSHDLWLRRFAADPRVVGASLEIDGRPHQIIGVMPKGFKLPAAVELWAPLVFTPAQLANRSRKPYEAIGRLRPGKTAQQADAEIKAIAARIAQQNPLTHKGRSARLALYRKYVSGDYTAEYTLMMFAATAFVLLIACVNLATLLFARSSLRHREMAVRAALGATRWRLSTLLVTESAALGLLGALAGILFASWGIDLFRAGMPAEVERYLPGWSKVGVNFTVLAFAVFTALLCGIGAGLAPALQASRVSFVESLKEGGRTGSTTRRHRLVNTLVVVEIVLALVLLVGAGLMSKGLYAMSKPYAPDVATHSLKATISLPAARFPDLQKQSAFQRALFEKLRALPGVDSAATVLSLPYSQAWSSSTFEVEGAAYAPGESPVAHRQIISPGLFTTLHIPIVEGRAFLESDSNNSQRVAIVNEAMVRRHFSSRSPIGRRIRITNGPWFTIVGVSKDVRQTAMDRSVRPALFLPYTQHVCNSFDVVLHTPGDPSSLGPALRNAVLAVDRDQPISGIMTIETMVANTLSGLQYVAVSLAIYGLLALVLATVGVYSVMSNAVAERTQEIGLRMAMGAKESEVLHLVMRRGLTLTAVGLAIGAVLSFLLARSLAGLIFGVSATDPTSYFAVTVLFLLTAALACYIPARRAMRLDPVIALRHE